MARGLTILPSLLGNPDQEEIDRGRGLRKPGDEALGGAPRPPRGPWPTVRTAFYTAAGGALFFGCLAILQKAAVAGAGAYRATLQLYVDVPAHGRTLEEHARAISALEAKSPVTQDTALELKKLLEDAAEREKKRRR